jgi:hypothetical protein
MPSYGVVSWCNLWHGNAAPHPIQSDSSPQRGKLSASEMNVRTGIPDLTSCGNEEGLDPVPRVLGIGIVSIRRAAILNFQYLELPYNGALP